LTPQLVMRLRNLILHLDGDTSTLADPTVVEVLIRNRAG
jgi:hypothetical protein